MQPAVIYPYFETQLWTGRLQAPPEQRHTPIGRLFESGRIGGSTSKTERFADSPEGRAKLILWARRQQGERMDIAYIKSPRRCRVPIPVQIVFRPEFTRAGVPAQLR